MGRIPCESQHRVGQLRLEDRRVGAPDDLRYPRESVICPRRDIAVPDREGRFEQNPVETIANHLAERIDVGGHHRQPLRQGFQDDHPERFDVCGMDEHVNVPKEATRDLIPGEPGFVHGDARTTGDEIAILRRHMGDYLEPGRGLLTVDPTKGSQKRSSTLDLELSRDEQKAAGCTRRRFLDVHTMSLAHAWIVDRWQAALRQRTSMQRRLPSARATRPRYSAIALKLYPVSAYGLSRSTMNGPVATSAPQV